MGYSSSIQEYFIRIPLEWWLLVVMVGIVLSLILGEMYSTKKKGILQMVLFFFLFEYLLVVLISTVFSRVSSDEYLYKLELFWSYRNFLEIGVIGVLFENVYNLFLLFPYGFCVRIIFARMKLVWIWVSGTFISLIIEFLQLALKKGYFELDDIFHNSIGVLLGCLFYFLVVKISKKRRNLMMCLGGSSKCSTEKLY